MKKTPAGTVGLNAASDMLCEHYEQMRCYVLECSAPGQVYGLAVMLQKGMRAWIEAAGEYVQPKTPSSRIDLKQPPSLLSSAQKELTAMIAGIIPNHGQKEIFKPCR